MSATVPTDQQVSSKTIGGRERIGRVIANTGRDILVIIEGGQSARAALRLGDVVVIAGEEQATVGMVSGMNVPAPGLETQGDDLWIAQVELSGTLGLTPGAPPFSQSIPFPPALGDVSYKASATDLRRLFRNGDEGAYPIGTVLGQHDVAATIDAAGLLDGGFAVLGAPSSGKSATVASLVRAMLRHRHDVRTILIDPYNEYGHSFGKAAVRVTPEPGLIPHWLLSFDELLWVLSTNGGTLGEDETSILEEAIPAAKLRFIQRQTSRSGGGRDAVSVDSPIPYRITDLVGYVDKNTHSDNARGRVSFSRLRTRIMAALADPKLSIFFGSVAPSDNLGELIKHLFRLDDKAPPMAVVQLGHLAAGVDQLVVSIICRLAAAVAEWGQGTRETLIVFEDAARFAPATPHDKIGQLTLQSIRRLGGRPRKLGTSIGAVFTHPASVCRDVLRQCGTSFIHRMPSQSDVDAVEDLLPEAAGAYLGAVANLGEGEAIGVGRGVPLAGRIGIARLPDAAIPSEHLVGAPELPPEADEVAGLVHRWRYCGAVDSAAE
ncbi:MAG: ATP-binding protein [Pseudomonadota bacterium]